MSGPHDPRDGTYDGIIAEVKEEAAAAVLWRCGHIPDRPAAPVSLAVLRRGSDAQATENMATVAAVAVHLLHPDERIVWGKGYGAQVEGGVARFGASRGAEFGFGVGVAAIRDHLLVTGLHGRECFGYGAAYALAYLAACFSPARDVRWKAYRLLWGQFALFTLTDRQEIGCRADGEVEENLGALLDLAAGREVPWPRQGDDYRLTVTAAKAAHEAGLLALPKIQHKADAIHLLVAAQPRCWRGFEWQATGRAVVTWGARLIDPEKCGRKGGYTPEVNWSPEHQSYLSVTSSGASSPVVAPRRVEGWAERIAKAADLLSGQGEATDPKPTKPRPEIPGREPDLLDPLRHALRGSPLPHRGARKLAEYVLGEIEGVRGVAKIETSKEEP